MDHPRHYLMQTALRKWAFEQAPLLPAAVDPNGDARTLAEIISQTLFTIGG